jgi:cysteine desulfurase/selenocysteine lyase
MSDVVVNTWNTERARAFFPAYLQDPFSQQVNFDHASTSLRFKSALDSLQRAEEFGYGNANRGAHKMAGMAAALMDDSRERVASFFGVNAESVAFVSGATDAANMLANSLCASLKPMDIIYVSALEHHANYLPWLNAASRIGFKFKEIPLAVDGGIDLDWLENHIGLDQPKIIAMTAMSNVTGYEPPLFYIKSLIQRNAASCQLVVDAAQAITHMEVSKYVPHADWLFFSSHKSFSTAGSGAIISCNGPDQFSAHPPGKFGGGMIKRFSGDNPIWVAGNSRAEAGTQNLGAIAALATSLADLSHWDMESLRVHYGILSDALIASLRDMDGVRILGRGERSGIVSFDCNWAHPHDIGSILDSYNIAVRVGHHCAIPLMRAMSCDASIRVSFGPGSELNEIHEFLVAMMDAKRRLS